MSNKELVRAFYKEFFNDHDVDAALKYVKEDYIQHNPGVTQGRKGIMDGFREKFRSEPTFHLHIVEEGDLVMVFFKCTVDMGVNKVCDIYRMQDGKLAEHWDVLMPC